MIRAKGRPLAGWLVIGWLVVVVLFTAAVRFRLLDVPLERDEGEYAYIGQLLLAGIAPYEQATNMKLPGIYGVYSLLLAVFGPTRAGIHAGLLVVNALTIVLVFALARRLMSRPAAVVAAAGFALFSLSRSLQGIFANAEHFVLPVAVGGLLLLLQARRDKRRWLVFLSGVLLGIGFVIKQHGAAFIAGGAFYLAIDAWLERPVPWRPLLRRYFAYGAGAVLPYAALCLVYLALGAFGKFWFWTMEYAFAYVSQVPLGQAWAVFRDQVAYVSDSTKTLWVLAIAGLIALVWSRRPRRQVLFVAVLAVFSFLAICPGFFFRPHYFLLLTPAAALLAGTAVDVATARLVPAPERRFRYLLPLFLAGGCLAFSIVQQRQFFFRMTPAEASRATYGLNPFPESIAIAEFIRARTRPDERIAVVGSEPQIYFYADRRSVLSYVYMYPLMESHDFALEMQKEVMAQIRDGKPSYMVFVNVPSSWLAQRDSPRLLLQWFNIYRAKYYRVVGLVEIFADQTRHHWAPEPIAPPRSRFWVSVLERRAEPPSAPPVHPPAADQRSPEHNPPRPWPRPWPTSARPGCAARRRCSKGARHWASCMSAT